MNYLMHHGILGQKWGVRRFRNKDGSYTKEGLSRRAKSDNRSDDAKRYNELKKKKVNEMTTKELREYSERAEAIKRFKANKSKLKKAIAFAGVAASVVGTINGLSNGYPQLLSNGRKFAGMFMNVVTNPFTTHVP